MEAEVNPHLQKKQNPPPNCLNQKYTVSFNRSVLSSADKIRKLAKLKEEGILTDEEFKQMKQDLIRKNR